MQRKQSIETLWKEILDLEIAARSFDVDEASPLVITPISSTKAGDLAESYREKLEQQHDKLSIQVDGLKELVSQLEMRENFPPTTVPGVIKSWADSESALGSAILSPNSISYPRLVRLDGDELLTRQLHFDLRAAETSAGCWNEQNDIVIYGGGTLGSHCVIRNTRENGLEIVASPGAECLHNGVRLPECLPIPLGHNDSLVLGVRNVFHVMMCSDSVDDSIIGWKAILTEVFQPSNPLEAAKLNSNAGVNTLKERITSIGTLHDNFPEALIDEDNYNSDIDEEVRIIEADMMNFMVCQMVYIAIQYS